MGNRFLKRKCGSQSIHQSSHYFFSVWLSESRHAFRVFERQQLVIFDRTTNVILICRFLAAIFLGFTPKDRSVHNFDCPGVDCFDFVGRDPSFDTV